jgi:hypothetical protein
MARIAMQLKAAAIRMKTLFLMNLSSIVSRSDSYPWKAHDHPVQLGQESFPNMVHLCNLDHL